MEKVREGNVSCFYYIFKLHAAAIEKFRLQLLVCICIKLHRPFHFLNINSLSPYLIPCICMAKNCRASWKVNYSIRKQSIMRPYVKANFELEISIICTDAFVYKRECDYSRCYKKLKINQSNQVQALIKLVIRLRTFTQIEIVTKIIKKNYIYRNVRYLYIYIYQTEIESKRYPFLFISYTTDKIIVQVFCTVRNRHASKSVKNETKKFVKLQENSLHRRRKACPLRHALFHPDISIRSEDTSFESWRVRGGFP